MIDILSLLLASSLLYSSHVAAQLIPRVTNAPAPAVCVSIHFDFLRSYIELCDSNNTVPRSPVSVSKPKAYRAAASVAGKPRSCRSVAHTLTICDNPDTATVVPIVVRLILVYRASLTYDLHRSPQLM